MAIRKKLTGKFSGLRKGLAREKGLMDRLKNIGHLLTGNVLTSLMGLVGFALTARALGPTDYGILALCFTYTSAVERLVNFQSWQPLIKYGAEAQNAEKLSSLLKFGLLLDISAAATGWLIAVALVWTAAPWFGISKDMSGLVTIYCSLLPFQITGMPIAVLRLFGKFRSIAYGQIASSVLRVVLCTAGVVTGAGLFEFVLIWMTSQIIGSLTGVALSLLELQRQGMLSGMLTAPVRGITSRFPGLWKFAISTNISLTLRSSANQFDTLLVGYLGDPAAAGLYHIAKRIGRIALQAGDQVQAVLYPELARAWASQAFSKFRRTVVQMQALLVGFGILLIGGIYFTIGPLLQLAVGSQFVGAAPLVVVQSVAVTVVLFGTVMRSALLAMGREDEILRSVFIATIAFHTTALLLIPRIGPMGANIAHIVMASIWLTAMTIVYRRGRFKDR
ncbi:lipopolysaccharide biosynthesis protein [Sinorhizobium numidicum]|uniref:Lipopolysaccharide biosynthesis protein n=1 Tax=Sinorhizobium numidicum TaxID=680248 RepID=A0ABY8CVX0_9HYPH|nr:lipopolysaccharide biosynthesis protein [Sinorhizobium numidicum]WEX75605.1 lipopolysaccharide biosynthesis protein [Sinorhizobium numidicum]WEX81602.1 lipopolysaccharide biosynthesis protein [Sinorhizobium numidicum]